MISFGARGATSRPYWVVLPVLTIASNWTGQMEQDGFCLQQTSLQRRLNGPLEPQLNITDKQTRSSRSVTSGAIILFSLYRPGLCCLSACSRVISATRTKKISRKCSFGDPSGVGCPLAGGGGSALVLLIECPAQKQLLTLFFLPVVCRSVPSLGGRAVSKEELRRGTMQRQFIRLKSASAGSEGVFLCLINCRLLRNTDRRTVSERRHLNGWNG